MNFNLQYILSCALEGLGDLDPFHFGLQDIQLYCSRGGKFPHLPFSRLFLPMKKAVFGESSLFPFSELSLKSNVFIYNLHSYLQ